MTVTMTQRGNLDDAIKEKAGWGKFSVSWNKPMFSQATKALFATILTNMEIWGTVVRAVALLRTSVV